MLPFLSLAGQESAMPWNAGRERLLVLGICLPMLCPLSRPTRVGAQEQGVQTMRLAEEHGMRRYVSRRWGVVGVDLANPTDVEARVLAATMFQGDADLQYGREFWVPARAIRRSWTPVRMPHIPHGAQMIQCESLLLHRRDGKEVAVRRPGMSVANYSYLRVDHSQLVTGIISPDAWESPREGIDYAYEAIIALRTAVSLDRRTAIISDRYLPILPEALDGLDQLVLMDDRFAQSVGGISAIRGWLNQGGCLWIMLDRVDFEGVDRLLGEAFGCEYIDRVELNEVDICPEQPRPMGVYQPLRRYEQPVPLVRVAVDGMDVVHRVNGWPAAFTRRVGQGNVIFTTVGVRAWIDRDTTIRGDWEADFMTDFRPTGELMDLAIMRSRTRTRFPTEAAVPYLAEQVGYEIPSRRPVLMLLGSFAGALLLISLCLAWAGRLAQLGWIAPTLALFAAVPLVGIGSRAQHAVPPTLGQLQLIAVSESGNHATACGVLGAYYPGGSREMIGADAGGVFESPAANQHDALRRMVWSDSSRWQMERCRMPTGIQVLPFSRSLDLKQSIHAVGTFDDRGLRVRVSGLPELSDAILALPGQPQMALRRDGDEYTAERGDILAAGQYLAEGWVDDEQDRRQAVYQALMEKDRQFRQWVSGPTVLGWGPSEDLQFRFPELTTHVGSTLWKLPLTLQRPAPGTRITIPSPLVSYRTSRGPAGVGVSSLYEHATGKWVQSNQPASIWLTFELPRELLPLRVEQALLTVDLTAPDRTLQVVRSAAGSGHEVVWSQTDPLGHYELLLSDAHRLVDGDGALQLGVLVSRMEGKASQNKTSVWKINRLQLEVVAKVPDAAGAQAQPGGRQ
jgi:hypothetical protein